VTEDVWSTVYQVSFIIASAKIGRNYTSLRANKICLSTRGFYLDFISQNLGKITTRLSTFKFCLLLCRSKIWVQ